MTIAVFCLAVMFAQKANASDAEVVEAATVEAATVESDASFVQSGYDLLHGRAIPYTNEMIKDAESVLRDALFTEFGASSFEEALEKGMDVIAYDEMSEEEAAELGYYSYTFDDGTRVWYSKHEIYGFHSHDDGSMNEYEEGYFVAHSDTYYGQGISSLYPGAVVTVNGRDVVIDGYIYDNYNSGDLWDIRGRVGWDKVCFQTCVGNDGTIIVYYGHYTDGSVPNVEKKNEYDRQVEEYNRQVEEYNRQMEEYNRQKAEYERQKAQQAAQREAERVAAEQAAREAAREATERAAAEQAQREAERAAAQQAEQQAAQQAAQREAERAAAQQAAQQNAQAAASQQSSASAVSASSQSAD